jgi:hypothetical protein
MLKLKKYLFMGLLTAAVGLFVPSCTIDDEEDPVDYDISIAGGTGASITYKNDPPVQKTILYVGDKASIYAGTPPVGRMFDYWSVSPAGAVSFADDENDRTTITVKSGWDYGQKVTITANFVMAYYAGEAKVRYTWETLPNKTPANDIKYIEAGIGGVTAGWGVEWWYNEIYLEADDEVDVFTDYPWRPIKGNPNVTGSIYSMTTPSNTNNGKYFDIEPGRYTAVCSAEDQLGYFDIVANYTISPNNPATATSNGLDNFFEIAFDVGAYVEGLDEKGWFTDDPVNTAYTPPMLSKKASKTVVKKDFSADIDYYVYRRAKK